MSEPNGPPPGPPRGNEAARYGEDAKSQVTHQDAAVIRRRRPPEPAGTDHVWYRGWEVGYDHDAAYWGGTGWHAYQGGCDLDAREVMSATYQGCLDEVDEQEDE